MKTGRASACFLGTLERMAMSHGIRALTSVEAVAAPLGLRTSLVADHWAAIEQHKWMMRERLGRDVGPKVAALDYFEHFLTDKLCPVAFGGWGYLIKQFQGGVIQLDQYRVHTLRFCQLARKTG
jgi:hypothetical protein